MRMTLVRLGLSIQGILCCGGLIVGIACVVRTVTAGPACAVCGKWDASVTVGYVATGKWNPGIFGTSKPAEPTKYYAHFCKQCPPPAKVPLHLTDSASSVNGWKVFVTIASLASGGLIVGLARIFFREALGSYSFARSFGERFGISALITVAFVILAILGWRIGVSSKVILLSGVGILGQLITGGLVACLINKKQVTHVETHDSV